MKLGKKILVVGISASGKSFFARKLAAKTGLPLVSMDFLMWKPGWNYIGDEAVVKKLGEISSEAEWIIEGYIPKGVRTLVFDRADTILYLDYSSFVGAWQYLKRWWKHRKDARPELEGSPEQFSFKFLKLVWTKGEAISLDESLTNIGNQNKIVRLTSPKATIKLTAELTTEYR